MAKDSSFDIVSEFDMQELRNAVDQVKKEVATRYDFKGEHTEIELTDEKIHLEAVSDFKLTAIHSVLTQKLINRGVSPKILDLGKVEPTSNGNVKQDVTLIKALDQDNAKIISKLIRDGFPKVKSAIQGACVRVSSAKKDDLQAAMKMVKESEEVTVPVQFTNYR
ncbi:YajQ family cyclic di-GMP-binding protein [Patescibacteria group bacterium]|nr:YajQ family cyclic di-GMP-binding protein [Patescibacteria group bacterium]